MEAHILQNIVLVIVLGIGAQWLAWRIRIPSILLLLILGFLAGPITGIIAPETLHGEWLFAFVSLAIGVILFEGGLSLQISELAEVGRSVRNLITTGVLITGALAGFFAWWVVGMEPEVAILTGGILTVTGPTVVIPLLRHVRPRGRVSTIAKWEGITIDPVGAILAVLLLELVLAVGTSTELTRGDANLVPPLIAAAESLLTVTVLSVGVSILGATLQVVVLRKHLVPDYLQDPAALSIVLAAFAAAYELGGEGAALLTTTLMGIILANQPWVSVRRIVKFKEDLQVLLLACLFILLSARLDLGVLNYIHAQAFIYLALLIFLVRPLAVLVCSVKTGLNWREKVFIAWLAPRGIVAAAVAALFAERLVGEGYASADGDELIATVYLVVVGTVAVYGLTLAPIALRLGLADRNPQGVLFMGAYRWVQDAAIALQELGFRVLLIDANARNIEQARNRELPAVVADALSDTVTDELDLGGLRRFLAVTANDEINSLAALHFTEVFENKEVYQIRVGEGSKATQVRRVEHLRGRPLFGAAITQNSLTRRHREGGAICTFGLTEKRSYAAIRERFSDDVVLLFIIRGTNVLVHAEANLVAPQTGDTVVVMLPSPSQVREVPSAELSMELLAKAVVIDAEKGMQSGEIVHEAARQLGECTRVSTDQVQAALRQGLSAARPEVFRGAMVLHISLEAAAASALALVRSTAGFTLSGNGAKESAPIHALIVLTTPADQDRVGSLPVLAQFTGSARRQSFRNRWLSAKSDEELRAALVLHRHTNTDAMNPRTGFRPS